MRKKKEHTKWVAQATLITSSDYCPECGSRMEDYCRIGVWHKGCSNMKCGHGWQRE